MTNLLFICSRNRLRSPTGEAIFGCISGLQARSAGLSKDAEVPLGVEDIEWADIIFVMEQKHRRKLRQGFNSYLKNRKIVCLDIPDKYDFMDPELVEIFKRKIPLYLP